MAATGNPPKEKATSPAGGITVKVTPAVKVRHSDAASKAIASAMKLAKERQRQKDGLVEKGKAGDPSAPGTVKATGRKTRLAIAKRQSGPMVLYDFDEDNGFFAVQRKLFGERLTALNAYLDQYRADPIRDYAEKRRFPISSLQVIRRNSGGRRSVREADILMPTNTQYMLTGVRMSTKDKLQIVKSMSGFRIWAFENDPQVWSFQGFLFNTEEHNWLANFRATYAEYLSPKSLARLNAEVVLQFQDFLVTGIIFDPSMALSADQDGGVMFSFSMILLEESVFSTNAVLEKATRYKSAFTGPRPSGLVSTLVHEAYARKYGEPEARGGAKVLSEEDIKKLRTKEQNEMLELLSAYPAYRPGLGGDS